MFKDLDEKEFAAAQEAMRPIIDELVQAWGKIGNEVMEAHAEEIEGMFPEHGYKIVRMTIMNALPPFIRNCCLSISPATQLQLAATLTCEVLTAALALDKQHLVDEHALMKSIMDALRGKTDDDTSDDDDRGSAEH